MAHRELLECLTRHPSATTFIEPCVERSRRISIKDLLETIARQTGFGGEIVWDISKPNGQPRRKLDVSRAEQYFGFRSKVAFEAGLRRTMAWYGQQTANDQQQAIGAGYPSSLSKVSA